LKLAQFNAILFDFDGVIAHTESIHKDAWLDTLKPFGVEYDEATHYRLFVGLRDFDYLEKVNQHYQVSFSDEDKQHIMAQKTAQVMELLAEENFVSPSIHKFLELCKDRIRMAIVSGCEGKVIEHILRSAKINQYFEFIIAGEDVSIGKPDPEGYTKAAKLIECSPETCLVIEDSLRGIEAAKKANMACAAVTGSYPHSELAQSHAGLIADNFEELLNLLS